MMQRRKPVQRAFSGLVGLPPEPGEVPAAPDAPVAVETAADAPKKRGRPRVHANAVAKQTDKEPKGAGKR
jgi:hypothetical protein